MGLVAVTAVNGLTLVGSSVAANFATADSSDDVARANAIRVCVRQRPGCARCQHGWEPAHDPLRAGNAVPRFVTVSWPSVGLRQTCGPTCGPGVPFPVGLTDGERTTGGIDRRY